MNTRINLKTIFIYSLLFFNGSQNTEKSKNCVLALPKKEYFPGLEICHEQKAVFEEAMHQTFFSQNIKKYFDEKTGVLYQNRIPLDKKNEKCVIFKNKQLITAMQLYLSKNSYLFISDENHLHYMSRQTWTNLLGFIIPYMPEKTVLFVEGALAKSELEALGSIKYPIVSLDQSIDRYDAQLNYATLASSYLFSIQYLDSQQYTYLIHLLTTVFYKNDSWNILLKDEKLTPAEKSIYSKIIKIIHKEEKSFKEFEKRVKKELIPIVTKDTTHAFNLLIKFIKRLILQLKKLNNPNKEKNRQQMIGNLKNAIEKFMKKLENGYILSEKSVADFKEFENATYHFSFQYRNEKWMEVFEKYMGSTFIINVGNSHIKGLQDELNDLFNKPTLRSEL